MSDYDALLRELQILEQIQTRLAHMATRQDNARKAETVALRRELSKQIGILGEAGRATLGQSADAEFYDEYRKRLSAMRTAIALHQSEWPAISLDETAEGYRLSVQRVLKARENFTPWAIAKVGARKGG
ncbi:MAG: hypothetical protein HC788_00195 [Sphingopyxis sp.]|nr:hypothetical protein [Sphingopyxis sp.]